MCTPLWSIGGTQHFPSSFLFFLCGVESALHLFTLLFATYFQILPSFRPSDLGGDDPAPRVGLWANLANQSQRDSTLGFCGYFQKRPALSAEVSERSRCTCCFWQPACPQAEVHHRGKLSWTMGKK